MKKIISLLIFGLILSKCYGQIKINQLHIIRYPATPIVRDSDRCITYKYDSTGSAATVDSATCTIYFKDFRAFCITGTSFADTNKVHIQYLASVTGAHDTSNGNQTMLINPSGTLANLGVVTPANPYNGQTFNLIITQAITSIVFSGRTGTLLTGSTSAGYHSKWIYYSATGWVQTD